MSVANIYMNVHVCIYAYIFMCSATVMIRHRRVCCGLLFAPGDKKCVRVWVCGCVRDHMWVCGCLAHYMLVWVTIPGDRKVVKD